MKNNVSFIHSEIGTAKDNTNSPVHNWYKFTAGFSYKLINELHRSNIINNSSCIYEPFAGCGTTLVETQKHQIKSIGNEGQDFMYNIIRAKIKWNIDLTTIKEHIKELDFFLTENLLNEEIEKINPLMNTLYTVENVNVLYKIKCYIQEKVQSEENQLFLNLALSQTLHKCSLYPISSPYISRNKALKNNNLALTVFKEIISNMITDVEPLKNFSNTSVIHLHDSRTKNEKIEANECDVCITSPPYLNNLDYGEVSKVQSHFFEITNNWNDITQNVRKKLVTASTTHYGENSFNLEKWKKEEFYTENRHTAEGLIKIAKNIKISKEEKKGGKSFDILTLLYFQDMYHVIKEMRRVLTSNGKSFLVLGDSAPYGIFVPTTDILANIANNVGFENTKKYKIRERGTKWKGLTFRHSLSIDENILSLS